MKSLNYKQINKRTMSKNFAANDSDIALEASTCYAEVIVLAMASVYSRKPTLVGLALQRIQHNTSRYGPRLLLGGRLRINLNEANLQ